MTVQADFGSIRSDIVAYAPDLAREVGQVSAVMFDRFKPFPTEDASLLDPDLGWTTLTKMEAAVLQSPILSRLRGVRRNRAASMVFPGYSQSVFEFSCSTLAWAARYLRVLSEKTSDPELTPRDIATVRLAALLKHVSACALGDDLWRMPERAFHSEFHAASVILAREFHCSAYPISQHVVTALLLLSDSFVRFLANIAGSDEAAHRLALATISVQLGAGRYLDCPCLAELVEGPLSAERFADLSYGNRVTGAASGCDFDHLLHCTRIVRTGANGTDQRLAHGAAHALVVEERASSSLEHFAISRILLRDRVVNQPTVRAARLLAQRFGSAIEEERGDRLGVRDLLVSDDEMFIRDNIAAAGGRTKKGARVVELGRRLLNRELPKAVLLFGPGFLASQHEVSAIDAADHAATIMRQLRQTLSDPAGRAAIEAAIAQDSRRQLKQSRRSDPEQSTYEIFVDLPDPNWIGANRFLVLTRAGEITLASSLFATGEWSSLYFETKWAGRVYCDSLVADEVRRSARHILERDFGLTLSPAADRKIGGARREKADYFPRAPRRRSEPKQPVRLYIENSDLILPPSWAENEATVRETLSRKLRAARQRGYSARSKAALIRLIDALSSFQVVCYEGGTLQGIAIGQERQLQRQLRDHMRSRGFSVREKLSLGAGEVDLYFDEEIVIEIKIFGRPTDRPLKVGPSIALQARRYALALSKSIVATVVGYQPKSEFGHFPADELIDIRATDDPRFVEVRVCVPLGFPVPSRARRRG